MNQELLLFMAAFILHYANGAKELVPFVTPGLPACFVASTPYETVDGAAKLCSHIYISRSDCGFNGEGYYFYCSDDHNCCYHNNCPACCTRDTTLNKAEVAGIVTASVIFFAILVIVAYVIAGKFCIYKTMS